MSKQDKWTLVPIRMITGWAANWCNLSAVYDKQQNIVKFSDSEDLLWFVHLREPWEIDAGFYEKGVPTFSISDYANQYKFGGIFTVKFFDNSNGIKDSIATKSFTEPTNMIKQIEEWMLCPP